jgi:predicted MFS family arabinose efflux permease
LLQDIKRDFLLSDTQLGLLGGVAFAFFYSLLGIPIARAADRGNRRNVLIVCLLLWSLATALCGAAVGFLTLLAARVGTAIGEAGGSPASHALITDYFPAQRRATALAIFALGVPLGSIIGNLASGWLNEFFHWRYVFAAVGVPGVLLALLLRLSVKEPERVLPASGTTDPEITPTLAAACRYLWRQKSYVHMCFAAGLHSVVWYAGSTWNAAFLMRSHGLGSGAAGTWIASFSAVGLIGTFCGGYLADKLATRYGDPRWSLWLPGGAILLMMPFQFVAYLSPGLPLSVAGFWLMMIFASTFFGPSYAVSQMLAGPRMRALASSILLFVQTFIGLGLGPYLVGLCSDYLAPQVGVASLRYALVLVGLVNLWAVYHYFVGGRTYREDLAQVQGAAS